MDIATYISSMDMPTVLVIGVLVLIIVLYYFNYKKMNNSNESMEVVTSNNTNNKSELALYMTTWCGYSKQFMPVWEEIKKEVENKKLNVSITTHDCDKEAELCNKKGVEGFPTIILHLSDGRNLQYQGERTVQGVLQFVQKNI